MKRCTKSREAHFKRIKDRFLKTFIEEGAIGCSSRSSAFFSRQKVRETEGEWKVGICGRISLKNHIIISFCSPRGLHSLHCNFSSVVVTALERVLQYKLNLIRGRRGWSDRGMSWMNEGGYLAASVVWNLGIPALFKKEMKMGQIFAYSPLFTTPSLSFLLIPTTTTKTECWPRPITAAADSITVKYTLPPR